MNDEGDDKQPDSRGAYQMGTRADFYVGRGPGAEWLGSIAWDGYPEGIEEDILTATDEADYRAEVGAFLGREDGTTPAMGWPWPWDDSRTTDYAYAYEDGSVYASSSGHQWFRPDPAADNYGEPDGDDDIGKVAVFPDMTDRKVFTLGPRSGVIVFGVER